MTPSTRSSIDCNTSENLSSKGGLIYSSFHTDSSSSMKAIEQSMLNLQVTHQDRKDPHSQSMIETESTKINVQSYPEQQSFSSSSIQYSAEQKCIPDYGPHLQNVIGPTFFYSSPSYQHSFNPTLYSEGTPCSAPSHPPPVLSHPPVSLPVMGEPEIPSSPPMSAAAFCGLQTNHLHPYTVGNGVGSDSYRLNVPWYGNIGVEHGQRGLQYENYGQSNGIELSVAWRSF